MKTFLFLAFILSAHALPQSNSKVSFGGAISSPPAPPPPPPPEPLVIPGPGGPQRKRECNEDTDCKAYHYCHHSYWVGSRCLTNKERKRWGEVTLCRGQNKGDESKFFPDHQICAAVEAQNDNFKDAKFSVSRCFAELGYQCANAYFMPCTPNYDNDGNAVRGQQNECPQNFRCVSQRHKGGEVRLCKPNAANPERSDDACETDFDCGYSLLEGKWSRCLQKRCLRVVE